MAGPSHDRGRVIVGKRKVRITSFSFILVPPPLETVRVRCTFRKMYVVVSVERVTRGRGGMWPPVPLRMSFY